jgi:hypothetical protein
MRDADRPAQDQVLERLRRTVHQPLLELSAVRMAGAFDESVPVDVASDLLAETTPDRKGWSVDAERAWKLEALPGVLVLVVPGRSLEETLAQLDRVRAELVARPELLDPDWSRPLQRKPQLRLVKPSGGESR